jgi:hypothetical protein
MKKLYVIGLLLFSLQSCGESAPKEEGKVEVKQDQVIEKVSVSELSSLEKRKLPSTAIPKGTLVYAGAWDDAEGKHIITLSFISSTREDREYEFTYESTHLYAHHYLLDTLTNSYKETWKIKEFVNDCEFDLTAEFINNAIQISDENENGIAEVWTMYKTACRSDVSPCALKLIMYEGALKHAMRGSMRIDAFDEPIGGEYKFDEAFKAANPAVKEFAKKMWMENRDESFN